MSEQVYAHFIGAGGAGMSGIALVLAERGVRVTGSDLKASRYSRALEAAGVPVAIGHDAENLGDPDVVVVSSAIPETNPELAAARASAASRCGRGPRCSPHWRGSGRPSRWPGRTARRRPAR